MSVKDEFAYHELLHASSLIVSLFEKETYNHPTLKLKREKGLKRKARRIAEDLAEFYQLVGARRYELFSEIK